jgi:hypothetical protein
MIDTPETDATEMPIDRVDTVASRPCCIVNADFARKLERERDEALALAEERKTYWDSEYRAYEIMRLLWKAATKERDQWRECAQGLILYAREARTKAVADKWGLEIHRLNADIARFERLKEASK